MLFVTPLVATYLGDLVWRRYIEGTDRYWSRPVAVQVITSMLIALCLNRLLDLFESCVHLLFRKTTKHQKPE